MERKNKHNKSDRDEAALREIAITQYIHVTHLPESPSKKIDLHLLVFLYREMKTY